MDKKNKIPFLLLCGALLLSCLQEEPFPERENHKAVFLQANPVLRPVTSTLEAIDTRQPFMQQFCNSYGTPLWEYTDIYQESGDSPVYFWVPLYDSRSPKNINSLWFFQLKDDKLTYAPVRRDDGFVQEHGQEFMFDYLAFKVFGEENEARMIFKDPPQTRGWSYERIGESCQDRYIVWDEGAKEILIYDGRDCKDIMAWVYYTSQFDSDFSPIRGGGGGSGVDVPVGGEIDTTNAKDIFEHPNMIDKNWEMLEKLLEKIMKECAGGELYSKLRNELDGDKINIRFRDEPAGYDYEDNTLYLPIVPESNELFHEMFHALQYIIKGETDYLASLLNCEIEAHYAQYDYVKRLPEYKGNKWEKIYTFSDRGKIVRGIEFWGNQAKLFDDDNLLNDYINESVVNTFQQDEEYKKEVYTFKKDVSHTENLSLFYENSKDCN